LSDNKVEKQENTQLQCADVVCQKPLNSSLAALSAEMKVSSHLQLFRITQGKMLITTEGTVHKYKSPEPTSA